MVPRGGRWRRRRQPGSGSAPRGSAVHATGGPAPFLPHEGRGGDRTGRRTPGGDKGRRRRQGQNKHAGLQRWGQNSSFSHTPLPRAANAPPYSSTPTLSCCLLQFSGGVSSGGMCCECSSLLLQTPPIPTLSSPWLLLWGASSRGSTAAPAPCTHLLLSGCRSLLPLRSSLHLHRAAEGHALSISARSLLSTPLLLPLRLPSAWLVNV